MREPDPADTVGTDRYDSPTRPPAEEIVYGVDPAQDVIGAHRTRFDVPATIGGALAALGTLLLLSSLVGTAIGTIGYQYDVRNRDLSVGGLIGGFVVLSSPASSAAGSPDGWPGTAAVPTERSRSVG